MKHLVLNSAIVSAALILIPSTAAFAQNPNSNPPAGDQAFLTQMAQGNVAEIELGKLAQHKGNTVAVRNFGTRMVRDHENLNNQLKHVAAMEHVSLPTSPNPEQLQEKSRLEGLSGKAFDDAYMRMMLNDHQNDVNAVQQEVGSAQTPQVKQLAQRALPILQNHLRMAENDAGKLGISARKGLNQPSGNVAGR